MRRWTGVVNHRASCANDRHQKSPVNVAAVAVPEHEVREKTSCRRYNFNAKKENTGNCLILLRTVRIVSVLIVLFYVWLSSGAIATTITTSSTTARANSIKQEYEVEPSGTTLPTYEERLMHMAPQEDPPSPLFSSQHQHEQKQQHQLRQQQQIRHATENHSIPQSTSPEVSVEKDVKDGNDQCGLFLAPSTIPGAGLGMFTAVHRSVGETVGTGEVIIPLVELQFYNGKLHDDLFNPFQNYYWRGMEKGLHGIVAEHRSNSVQAYVPGLDAAINCNLALNNVDMSGSVFDDGKLNRYHHAMAGAMTPYHSTSSQVTREIPAGGELFKFYGDQWFVAREEKFGLIPLSDDYPAAQEILNKFDLIRKRHFASNDNLQKELWSLVKDDIGGSMWESRIMNALPQTVNEAQKAAKKTIASLHQPQAIRPIEYLREHGRCVDSIRPGASTLPSKQAGKGAFATRNFAKGSVITGTPLNHVPNRDFLTMYRMERNNTDAGSGEETWFRHVDNIVNHQIILSYCYGNHQSTMLLCPYGSGVNYINHNQTLANVKIQWPAHGTTMHNASWLTGRRVQDLEWEYDVGLAFDFVATKDIQEGEELFLDYGDDFERALTNYMTTWHPASPATFTANDFVAAESFNRKVKKAALRTDEEQKQHPYPDNVETRCHPALVDRGRRKQQQENLDEYQWETREIGFPCTILDRREPESEDHQDGKPASLYTVELKLPLEEVGLQFNSDIFTYMQRKDVPRTAISFFNKPYTTDLFLQKSFRKEIGIPDEMFPPLWRNLKGANKGGETPPFP